MTLAWHFDLGTPSIVPPRPSKGQHSETGSLLSFQGPLNMHTALQGNKVARMGAPDVEGQCEVWCCHIGCVGVAPPLGKATDFCHYFKILFKKNLNSAKAKISCWYFGGARGTPGTSNDLQGKHLNCLRASFDCVQIEGLGSAINAGGKRVQSTPCRSQAISLSPLCCSIKGFI